MSPAANQAILRRWATIDLVGNARIAAPGYTSCDSILTIFFDSDDR